MKLLECSPQEFCLATTPCSEGHQFAFHRPSMWHVWEECPNASWLKWIYTQLRNQGEISPLEIQRMRGVYLMALDEAEWGDSMSSYHLNCCQMIRHSIPNPFPKPENEHHETPSDG